MADVLDQIQQRQMRAQNQQLAATQRDLDWNTTFGRVAPDAVLRETRNMTDLINTAIERKMALAAQTNEGAQRIWINDQKFKAWQKQQPLRDDLLRAQVADEEASQSARVAQELLTSSRREREARAIEHSALAQWELDQIESSGKPEAEKRAWLATVRGRYPTMDKASTDRYDGLHMTLNPPPPKPLTAGREFTGSDGAVYRFLPDGNTTRNGKPVEDVPEGVRLAPTRYMNVGSSIVNPETGQEVYKAPEKAKPAKPDSYEQLASEEKVESARDGGITPEQRKQFDRRRQALITAGRGQPAPPAAAPPAEPPKAAANAGPKLYTIDGQQIVFAAGSNFAASVQQALNDGLISVEQGREQLIKAGFKPKTAPPP